MGTLFNDLPVNTYRIALNIKERFKIIAVVVVPRRVHWADVLGSKIWKHMFFKFSKKFGKEYSQVS